MGRSTLRSVRSCSCSHRRTMIGIRTRTRAAFTSPSTRCTRHYSLCSLGTCSVSCAPMSTSGSTCLVIMPSRGVSGATTPTPRRDRDGIDAGRYAAYSTQQEAAPRGGYWRVSRDGGPLLCRRVRRRGLSNCRALSHLSALSLTPSSIARVSTRASLPIWAHSSASSPHSRTHDRRISSAFPL